MTPERRKEFEDIILEDSSEERLQTLMNQGVIATEELLEWISEDFPSCPNCATKSGGWFYCGKCGTPLPLPNHLNAVEWRSDAEKELGHIDHNHQRKEGNKFCVICGEKL